MAFLAKSRRSDPALKAMHDATIRWWFRNQLGNVLKSIVRRRTQFMLFRLDELLGGVQGLFGE